MKELEKIVYTKEFVDKLANGINPLDDTEIPDNDIMNNVRLSRCMFYVSNILRQVIENGGEVKRKKITKMPFSLTAQQLARYDFGEYPLPMSKIAKKIYALAENSAMEKLTYNGITAWLIEIGMLCEKKNYQGKLQKYPTEEGMEIGISCEIRKGLRGDYEVVLYNREAQQFILDNIEAIVSYNAQKN